METGLRRGILNKDEFNSIHSKELNIDDRTMALMHKAYVMGYRQGVDDTLNKLNLDKKIFFTLPPNPDENLKEWQRQFDNCDNASECI